MADDPFDDVLNLEDQFYEEGYRQGSEDGVKAGRIEGRSLGLEKGFDKFLESGRLHGKAIVWANRSASLSAKTVAATTRTHQADGASGPRRDDTNTGEEGGRRPDTRPELPTLPENPRLEKNINVLYALVEPESLSTENTDEAVNDFDDRIKRAQGKAKVIERTIGEGTGRTHSSDALPRS